MKTLCPYCNFEATGHETLDENSNPSDDDISFCIGCGELSEFKGKVLVKINLENLDKETREEINDIRVAWLKRRAIDGVQDDKKN